MMSGNKLKLASRNPRAFPDVARIQLFDTADDPLITHQRRCAVVGHFEDDVDLVAGFVENDKARLLVGVGTGNLANLLLSGFPDARLVGVDMVQDFISQAKDRFSSHGERASLICADVADFDLPSEGDIVVTSFMFHHLDDSHKQNFFRRIHGALRSDGCFVNLDFVRSPAGFTGACSTTSQSTR